MYPDQLRLAAFVLEARRGVVGDLAAQLAVTPPAECWRVNLVCALVAANAGDLGTARAPARRGRARHPHVRLRRPALARRAPYRRPPGRAAGAAPTFPHPPRRGAWPVGRRPGCTRRATAAGEPTRTLRVIGTAMAVTGTDEMTEVPGGNPQRLLGVVVANGGSATLDQLIDSIWPDEDSEASRARLRNVLLRLRRGVGDVVTRTASGVRLAADVTCDLLEFQRLATDALAAARTDPELAGQVATEAVQLADGPVFVDFEYEEWAAVIRRDVDQQLLGLLDLLSVQAEDGGDLAAGAELRRTGATPRPLLGLALRASRRAALDAGPQGGRRGVAERRRPGGPGSGRGRSRRCPPPSR